MACASADSDAATSLLSKWISYFGGMDWLVTDQGSHFKARLMKGLTEEMHIKHHFTVAYCPWSNGTVESLCKEVFRIAHALLSEWKPSVGQWPAILDAIQNIINQSAVQRLGRNGARKLRCPMEVFSGLQPPAMVIRPIPLRPYRNMRTIDEERCKEIMNIGSMHDALQQMHENIVDRNRSRRTRVQKIHIARTNVLPLNIYISSYVVVHTLSKRNHKLQTK